jgi:S-(hydroxymethyl)glutathione dehydrogenase/alcohol dehydrogenase
MKALVFHHPKKVSVDKVPDPKLIDSTDIILKVTSTAISGSDLHIYNGLLPQIRNQILGHEIMGIVEEVPVEVRSIKRGDRVIVSSTISCGHCYFCEHKLPNHCERSNFKNYGPEGGILTEKGAGVFGHTDLYGGYEGGQAEYARIPYAEFGCRKVPTDLSDDQVIFLTDIFPAGWTAIEKANLKGAETVAVFGCGPVGIMAQKAAWIHGAKRVIGIDLLDYRLEIAKKSARSEVINLNEIDPVEAIREMTHGRGADVVVDAVGMEANQHLIQKARGLINLEMGSINALKMCFSAVRRGGFVSVIGDYGTKYDHFPLGQFTDKGISMWGGLAPVQNYIDELLNLVKEKRVFLDDIITHKLPLSEAPQAYHMLNSKEDRCMKVILRPHESGWS